MIQHHTPDGKPATPPSASAAVLPKHSYRSTVVKWLRKTHGWIGLWGAGLFLLFGVTGFLLNHRAVMKIPAAQTRESTVQLPLPQPAPENAHAMAAWLQHQLVLDHAILRVRSEAPAQVAWGNQAVRQPARWTATFASPQTNIQMEYWVGNNYVSVKRSDNNLFATLTSLHKGSGVSLGWILLIDTLAASLILLPLTGVALWAMQNRRRMIGTAIALASVAAATIFTMQSM